MMALVLPRGRAAIFLSSAISDHVTPPRPAFPTEAPNCAPILVGKKGMDDGPLDTSPRVATPSTLRDVI